MSLETYPSNLTDLARFFVGKLLKAWFLLLTCFFLSFSPLYAYFCIVSSSFAAVRWLIPDMFWSSASPSWLNAPDGYVLESPRLTLLLTALYLFLLLVSCGWLKREACWAASLAVPSCFIWESLANSPEFIANSPFCLLLAVVGLVAVSGNDTLALPDLSLGCLGEF